MLNKIAYISCWKSGDEWVCGVYSEKGKNLGRYRSKDREKANEKAKKRLKQVEFFKRQGSGSMILTEMVKVANALDEMGLYKEAGEIDEQLRKCKQELDLCEHHMEVSKQNAVADYKHLVYKRLFRSTENLKNWFVKYLSEDDVDNKIKKLAFAFSNLHQRILSILEMDREKNLIDKKLFMGSFGDN